MTFILSPWARQYCRNITVTFLLADYLRSVMEKMENPGTELSYFLGHMNRMIVASGFSFDAISAAVSSLHEPVWHA